ncbi:Sulfotransferase domain protein [Polystyrenella longa]|uniref:Sulfotransferase domain protein n=1 Tax=Polystyrenella longa TaxID=2528007 RepID=A0A518CNV7_9PLAN|nr:sulfotransferase [Polystyrenella longa]QDU80874.1 Sulfotransferase domain protein [Polystyrenella longa]
MTQPNFLIIGAARSGTTALVRYLEQHPEIFITEPKEPHFWAFAGQTVNFQGPGDEEEINKEVVSDPDLYEQLYTGANGAKALGDGSVSTMYYPEHAIPTIQKYAPDAQLIALLRNPIDRAFSSFLYTHARVHEPVKDFDKALDLEEKRIADNWHHMWHYTRVGFYSEQLQKFIDAFGRERVHILLADDLRSDSEKVLSDVCGILGVNPNFDFQDLKEVNSSGVPKSRALARMINVVRSNAVLRSIAVNMTPLKLRNRVRYGNLSHPKLQPEQRERLRDVYRDEIQKLSEMLDRDLSHWLK